MVLLQHLVVEVRRPLEITANMMNESSEARVGVNKPACSSQVALAHLYKWSWRQHGESDASAKTFWFNADGFISSLRQLALRQCEL